MAKKKRRPSGSDDLNITSMMDMMTIILVFLLKSFSATEITVTPSDNLKLPNSVAQKDPSVAVNIVVAKNEILVDHKSVVRIESYTDPSFPGQRLYQIPSDEKQGATVSKLYDALADQATKAEALASKTSRDDAQFKGKVLLQIDKDIPYVLLRDVMYNAGQAKFAEFEFIVIKASE